MGHRLSESRRKEARVALSDLFNDFPVDYAHIAETLKDVSPAELHNILFSEVAPVCYTNIAAAVPTVWTGFDADSLNTMIDGRLAARKSSWARRQLDKILVAWLKYEYAYLWQDLHSQIRKPDD